jgi:cytochrome c oxidase cbb3-type subunit IV
MTHEFSLWLSKSFGLFYLLAMAVGVLIYAFWPANKARFEAAARAILEETDNPHEDGKP